MGTTIRFLPDYGADVPLWDGGGLMSDDPVWLRRHLNLEPALVAELAAWVGLGTQMNTCSVRRDSVRRDTARVLRPPTSPGARRASRAPAL